jgi:YjbR
MGPVRLATIERRIRDLALSFPEAYEDRPWGDFPVFKVGQNKVFGWAVAEDGAVRVTVKLTAEEREIAHLAHRSVRRPLRLDHSRGHGRGVARVGARVAARELLAQVPV